MSRIPWLLLGVLLAPPILFIGCTRKIQKIPQMESPQAKIYISKCGICHDLPHPRRHTFEQWQSLLPIMDQRMREKGFSLLNQEDKKSIRDYLKQNAY